MQLRADTTIKIKLLNAGLLMAAEESLGRGATGPWLHMWALAGRWWAPNSNMGPSFHSRPCCRHTYKNQFQLDSQSVAPRPQQTARARSNWLKKASPRPSRHPGLYCRQYRVPAAFNTLDLTTLA